MTKVNRNLHWSAVVGVAFSFWLLIWLILIVAALYDLKELSSTQAEFASVTVNEENTNVTTDTSDPKLFMVVVGVFALWAASRAKKRLDLLRHGNLYTAKIVREKGESHHYDFGYISKITNYYYRYQVDGKSYSHMLVWTFGLKEAINIVYNTRNPNYSAFVSRLRARFDPKANEWRSSMWHVIPRIMLLVIIVVGIATLLFTDITPFS